MAEQLIFDLASRPARGREDFFVSDANMLATARLDASETWPNSKLVIVGPEACGKTHLAVAWAGEHDGQVLTPEAIGNLDIPSVASPVVLDDADQLPQALEERFFHLHNHLAHARIPLLLTAREAPSRWPIALPDLKSRLEAIEVARIEAPDDALLGAVMLKLFADRQLAVTPNIVAWAVPRIERSFASVHQFVEELDRLALTEKRPVSLGLARAVLDNLPDNAR